MSVEGAFHRLTFNRIHLRAPRHSARLARALSFSGVCTWLMLAKIVLNDLSWMFAPIALPAVWLAVLDCFGVIAPRYGRVNWTGRRHEITRDGG